MSTYSVSSQKRATKTDVLVFSPLSVLKLNGHHAQQEKCREVVVHEEQNLVEGPFLDCIEAFSN